MNIPQQKPTYIVGAFTPANHGYRWICKKPSDGGAYVFVPHRPVNTGRFSFWPEERHEFIVHVRAVSQNGKTRSGDTVACLTDMQKFLEEGLAKATWELDRYGRPIARGLSAGGCEFEAHFDTGYRSDGQDIDPSVYFEPAKGSLYEDLARELRMRLGTFSVAEIARASAAKITPNEKSAPGLDALLSEKHGH